MVGGHGTIMSMPLLVVRHAHAGRRSAYKGDDRARPLSPRGVVRARQLVLLLSEYRPQRILSSPYVRCCATVQPLAESLGLAGTAPMKVPAQWKYLQSQAGHVQVFRQRVTIPNVDPTAYLP